MSFSMIEPAHSHTETSSLRCPPAQEAEFSAFKTEVNHLANRLIANLSFHPDQSSPNAALKWIEAGSNIGAVVSMGVGLGLAIPTGGVSVAAAIVVGPVGGMLTGLIGSQTLHPAGTWLTRQTRRAKFYFKDQAATLDTPRLQQAFSNLKHTNNSDHRWQLRQAIADEIFTPKFEKNCINHFQKKVGPNNSPLFEHLKTLFTATEQLQDLSHLAKQKGWREMNPDEQSTLEPTLARLTNSLLFLKGYQNQLTDKPAKKFQKQLNTLCGPTLIQHINNPDHLISRIKDQISTQPQTHLSFGEQELFYGYGNNSLFATFSKTRQTWLTQQFRDSWFLTIGMTHHNSQARNLRRLHELELKYFSEE